MSLKDAKQASELLLQSKKLRVAILGSGNIGTDLLLKIQRSEYMDCVAFIGRSFTSNGMIKALEIGVICSDKSIQYIEQNSESIDLFLTVLLLRTIKNMHQSLLTIILSQLILPLPKLALWLFRH